MCCKGVEEGGRATVAVPLCRPNIHRISVRAATRAASLRSGLHDRIQQIMNTIYTKKFDSLRFFIPIVVVSYVKVGLVVYRSTTQLPGSVDIMHRSYTLHDIGAGYVTKDIIRLPACVTLCDLYTLCGGQ